MALYFRRNEFIMTFVVYTQTFPSSRIFWNVPASWSAWQCVRMMPVCVCVCMYVCMWVCVCVYVCVCIGIEC
jgi:hypothetical protein